MRRRKGACYRADPERVVQETRRLFAREGVSPFPASSFLGTLLQVPILLVLFSVGFRGPPMTASVDRHDLGGRDTGPATEHGHQPTPKPVVVREARVYLQNGPETGNEVQNRWYTMELYRDGKDVSAQNRTRSDPTTFD